ncbi:hypothetical protein [Allocoleopsis sp.]|uniref:hypothetical protein n=1 Tax=Allocoleopsis sp. TaxID=3088169 RepID=UPI002FD258F9
MLIVPRLSGCEHTFVTNERRAMANRSDEWEKVWRRYQQYQAKHRNLLTSFGDEMSMSYFSDRFGSDNSMSKQADQGNALAQQLRKMEARMQEFVTQFCAEFPELEE